MENRYAIVDLKNFAETLLFMTGLPRERAAVVAEILVEGDAMGHTTHGLQLLAPYLRDLEAGKMLATGEPIVVADHGSTLTWDGQLLPGPWLVVKAMEEAFARIATHKVVTVVIRRSHHLACLATYLKRATDRGYVMLLMNSDPNVASVAPHGGKVGRFTPNPIAAGWPTAGDPVLLDISASTTTNGMVNRKHRLGEKFDEEWLVDNQGNPSNDPGVFFTDPPGAILPLGGMDLGHKGYALGLLVETMTSALGGYGRADQPDQWIGSVFLQMIDPDAFGGKEGFIRETSYVADSCRNTPVKAGNPPVRLPGQRALGLRDEYLAKGIVLHPEIMPAITPWAEKLSVTPPQPLN